MTTAEIITATIGVLALVISLINFRSAARDRRHSYQMQFVAKRNTARGKVNQVQNDATSRGQQLLGASGEISAVLERQQLVGYRK